jgi:heptosyltransferase II
MGIGMKVLVKASNWLGDAVMTLPTLVSLREMLPRGSTISVLTKPAFAELYPPFADEVIPHERGGVQPWVRTVRELKRRGFDAAVLMTRSFSSAFLIFSARVPRRIGYGGTLLTDRVQRAPRQHRVLDFHRLLEPLGTPPPVKAPKIVPRAEDVRWAEDALPGGPWIGLNPGATFGAAKQWYPERFIELARKLGRKVFVVGGPAEAELGERVAKGVDGLNLAGKTTLPRLAAAIARCELFITNDTGPMHVADAVGTSMVAIFGPTDWIETPPYGTSHTIVREEIACSPCKKRVCPLGHHDCMKKLSVDAVLRACEARLR